MSKFTGRVEFEWRQEGSTTVLYIAGIGIHEACRLSDTQYRIWHQETGGPSTYPTLEEAKAALLKALGIVVEWEGGEMGEELMALVESDMYARLAAKKREAQG